MPKPSPKSIDLPTATLSSTKKELLEAYQAARSGIEQVQSDLLNAEEARQKAEKLAAAKTAEAQAAGDPVRRLQDLRTEISREMLDLAQRYETEMATFAKIKQAIEVKQAELENLYGIETSAADLAALIAAQQQRKAEFEIDMSRRQTDLEAEMSATRTAWSEEKARRAAELKEEEQELKKRRQREQEDYDYALKREREQQRNTLEDELAALGKELTSRRTAFESEIDSREKNLAGREQTAAAQQSELTQLRERIDGFQNDVAAKVKDAVAHATQQLQSDFDKDRQLLQARFDGEKNVMLGKIESLEALVAAQRQQLSTLAVQQEKAYEKVQDIANRAVAAAKREVVAIHSPGPGKTTAAQE